MPPPTANWFGSRLRLAVAAALLLVASLLPAGSLGWANWMGDVVRKVVSPWQNALHDGAVWATRRVTGDPDRAQRAEFEELRRKAAAADLALVQANAQIEELRKRIVEVSRGMELNNLPVSPVAAPVIGGAADTASKALTVRAGRRQNVEVNNIAVTGGVHVVGVVKHVSDRTCTVLPITDRASDPIDGRIMLDDTTAGPTVRQLTPDGKGRLVGVVEDDPRFRDAAGRAIPVTPGMRVRVFEPTWPRNSDGLILGQVVKTEPVPSSPLRQMVTVQPIESIERITEVTVRTTAGGDGAGGPTTGGAP